MRAVSYEVSEPSLNSLFEKPAEYGYIQEGEDAEWEVAAPGVSAARSEGGMGPRSLGAQREPLPELMKRVCDRTGSCGGAQGQAWNRAGFEPEWHFLDSASMPVQRVLLNHTFAFLDHEQAIAGKIQQSLKLDGVLSAASLLTRR